jgi:acetate kinase
LSYQHIAGVLAAEEPALAAGRVVVAHLGSGASMCGMVAGRSVATSMGFSALDGLPMGTRCGQLDPGVILHFLGLGMTADGIEDLLYRRSGLLGLSGISSDMRALEASDAPEAAEAIAHFAARIRRETGALVAMTGGLDGLVFTAGIGEHSALLRAAVCGGLGWLGVTLDGAANAAHAREISAPGSAVRVLVIPTDEEAVIARAAQRVAGLPAG